MQLPTAPSRRFPKDMPPPGRCRVFVLSVCLWQISEICGQEVVDCSHIPYLINRNIAIKGYNKPSQKGVATMSDCVALCDRDSNCRSVDFEFGHRTKLCAYPSVDQWTANLTGRQGNWHYGEKCHGCNNPLEIPHSTRTCSQKGSTGFQVQYDCDAGYRFSDMSVSKVYTCSCRTETWETVLSSCKETHPTTTTTQHTEDLSGSTTVERAAGEGKGLTTAGLVAVVMVVGILTIVVILSIAGVSWLRRRNKTKEAETELDRRNGTADVRTGDFHNMYAETGIASQDSEYSYADGQFRAQGTHPQPDSQHDYDNVKELGNGTVTGQQEGHLPKRGQAEGPVVYAAILRTRKEKNKAETTATNKEDMVTEENDLYATNKENMMTEDNESYGTNEQDMVTEDRKLYATSDNKTLQTADYQEDEVELVVENNVIYQQT